MKVKSKRRPAAVIHSYTDAGSETVSCSSSSCRCWSPEVICALITSWPLMIVGHESDFVTALCPTINTQQHTAPKVILLRFWAKDGWVSPLKDPLLTAVPPLSMMHTPLSSTSPWPGFQASSLPPTSSDSSAAWKTHTGSKNRAVTCKNRNDGFQNRWMIISLHKNDDFSQWGSEQAAVRETRAVCCCCECPHTQRYCWFSHCSNWFTRPIKRYETIIVPYAQYSHSKPDKLPEDAELSNSAFYFYKRKCQMLDVFYAIWIPQIIVMFFFDDFVWVLWPNIICR